MEYVIAIYRSRSVTISAYNYLLNKGVNCALISTPRSANVGCGLSVKFSRDALSAVRAHAVSRRNLRRFLFGARNLERYYFNSHLVSLKY